MHVNRFSHSRLAFLQYACSVIFKVSVAASHTVGWAAQLLLRSFLNLEYKLVERHLFEERLSSEAVLVLDEHLDLIGPEFVSVNDLEHTLVLLPLSVLGVKKQEYALGTLIFSKVAQVHECALGKKRIIGVSQQDVEPVTREVHQARVLTESLGAE